MQWDDRGRPGFQAIRSYGSLSRREMFSIGTTAIVLTAIPASLLASAFNQRSSQTATQLQKRFQANPTVDTLLAWTDALYEEGDLEGVRKNFRLLANSNSDWSAQRDRVNNLYHLISLREAILTYTIPPGVSQFKPVYHLPLPRKDTSFVTVKSYSLRGDHSRQSKVDSEGNEYIEAKPLPNDDMVLEHHFSLQMHSYRQDLAKFKDGDPPKDTHRFLGRSLDRDGKPMGIPDGARCQAIVGDLGLNRGSALERLEKLLTWARRNLKSTPPGTDTIQPDSESVFGIMGGHCEHQAVALLALARAAGIPTRITRGASAIQWGNDKPNVHSVPEYYLNGLGWILPDASMPTWCTLHNCVFKYVYMAPGDSTTDNLCFLEATQYLQPWSLPVRANSTLKFLSEKLS